MTGALVRIGRRSLGRLRMALGQIGSSRPLTRDFGFSRGQPVDRLYIEEFLASHAALVTGRVLEIGDDLYSRRFGHDISRQDILHVDPAHRGATIVGDVSRPGVLPAQAFDCIILTQTLHLIFDMAGAIRELRGALRPGGTLLITVPGISPVDCGRWKDDWLWSLTETSLGRLLGERFKPGDVALASFGNLYAATAFLHGAAVQDLSRRKLARRDPAFPVVVAACARA